MLADEFSEKGHYFYLPDRRRFAFAGLWWGGDDDALESSTMLTTMANEPVLAIGHPRMPVLLTSEADYAQWLDPERSGRDTFETPFAPYGPSGMQRYAAVKGACQIEIGAM